MHTSEVLSMFNTKSWREAKRCQRPEGLPLHEVWQYNRSFYDKIMAEEMQGVNDSTYAPEYQALLDKRKRVQQVFLDAILEAGRESSYLIYLYDREADDGKQRSFEDWNQTLDEVQLKAIVRRQIKASTEGSDRSRHSLVCSRTQESMKQRSWSMALLALA